MKRYYLAIDIGASSGRHILGHMEDGKMVLEEVYRFPNGMQKRDGEKVWDIEALFEAVLAGMKKCRELGKIPVSVGIDTWAVDFVLLDKDDQRIGNAVAYRDDRTKGMDEEVYRTVPEEELYASTGIQKQIFNSIYQLMAWKKKKPEQLEKAETLLMIPDYLYTGTAAEAAAADEKSWIAPTGSETYTDTKTGAEKTGYRFEIPVEELDKQMDVAVRSAKKKTWADKTVTIHSTAAIPTVTPEPTANAFSEDIQHSLAAGMNAHVSKPVEMKGKRKILLRYS